MEGILTNNELLLIGTMAAAPRLSHESRGRRFYLMPLAIQRLSGAVDEIPVLLREEQLRALEVQEADRLCVQGELRSFNNRRGEGAKLVITAYARSIGFCNEPDNNRLTLRGSLCKTPNLRCTPMGREVCDLMLAVRRRYARSDYLPCICWGSLAREAATLPVGAKLSLSGRVQSRPYIKMTEDGPVEKIAYEVSASALERIDAETPAFT